MNNDLISRSTLKEDMKSRLSACNEWIEKAKDKETKIRASAVKAFIAEVIMTIDNAPTVEVPENAVNCVLTMFGECSYNETGCHDCEIKVKIRRALRERPQGEWIEDYTAKKKRVVACNKCHCLNILGKSNFCPNCGAKMKGGAE